jgi:hypothetical protein
MINNFVVPSLVLIGAVFLALLLPRTLSSFLDEMVAMIFLFGIVMSIEDDTDTDEI